MSDPLLRLDGLTVTYPSATGPVAAVHDLSLTVDRGEVLGLVGASGCGKTSVVSALSGLLPSSAAGAADRMTLGEIDLTGLDERGWQRVRGRRIGLVPQQPMTALTATVPVGRQLDWYLGKDSIDRHREALLAMGLGPLVDRPGDLPSRFSGGQLQRLLIAVNTLGGHPDLLLADEPTSTLDANVQRSILDRLAALGSDDHMAMVLVSHDLAVVARLADRIGVLHGGTIVETGTVDQIFGAPSHPVTRALVDAVPRRTGGASSSAGDTSDSAATVDGSHPTPVLQVDRLHHYYGRPTGSHGPGRVVRAVDDVSFAVGAGEVLAIVGQSGSGKSTLARAVVGALSPTGGSVRLDGVELRPARSLTDRRHVQLVGQNPRAALNRRRRVLHPLDQAQRVHGLGGDAADRRDAAARALAEVHLGDEVLERRPAELSGGELARVVIARALLLEPRLLLLDEPTASLDAVVKASILDLLGELAHRRRLAMVVITHELATARAVADRVLVMHDGRVVESGGTAEVLDHPGHDRTRDLVASEPVLR